MEAKHWMLVRVHASPVLNWQRFKLLCRLAIFLWNGYKSLGLKPIWLIECEKNASAWIWNCHKFSGFELHCTYCNWSKNRLLTMVAHMVTLIFIVNSSNGVVTSSNINSSLDFI